MNVCKKHSCLVFSIIYAIIGVVLTVFSYGFVDKNLHIFDIAWCRFLVESLSLFVWSHRQVAASFFAGILCILNVLWFFVLRQSEKESWRFKDIVPLIFSIFFACIFSYSLVSYDIFNYIETAKVSFFYKENPYVVMPIEIPNDPNLAFTRAANKLALYGPVWILLTFIPHTAGMGNIFLTLIAFKLFIGFSYLAFIFLIWKQTKDIKNVLFFAGNPLVVIEILVSAHNDLIMMLLASIGIILWWNHDSLKKIFGLFLFVSSVFIKGATIVLLPLFFFRKLSQERFFVMASVLLLLSFVIFGPLREELYPWYAIWPLAMISLLPWNKYKTLRGFMAAFSIGLECRHIPYMAMGYYEGIGPILRIIVTIVPVLVFGVFLYRKKIFPLI